MVPFQNFYELDGNDGEVTCFNFPTWKFQDASNQKGLEKSNLWSFITTKMPARMPMGSAHTFGWSTTLAKYTVIAKSWVAPLKSVIIPRLGLTATLVSVKTAPILCWELEYDYSGLTARSSLGTFPTMHIASMCLSPTESNRYAYDLVSGSAYVETAQNPADDASLGLYAHNLIESKCWWNGPEFHWKLRED